MIHFFAHSFATAGNGPSKFARAVREKSSLEELTLYTQDPGHKNQQGVVTMKPKPKWLKTNLAYFHFQSRKSREILSRTVPRTPEHVLVFNNLLAGRDSYTEGSRPSIGFLNDDNNIYYQSTSQSTAQRIQRSILKRLESSSAKACTLLIVNSEYLKRIVSNIYGISESKIQVLYKGVDSDSFESPYLPIARSKRPPIRIFFAKSDWRRGNLVNVIAAVKKVALVRNVTLRVAGTDGSDVPNSTANKFVKFLGIVDAQTIREELKLAHIFCTPAKFEALGVANMEAMLSRTPVIASNVGGIPEVTCDGAYARQVRPDDINAIAAAIIDIAENPEQTAQRVQSAWSHIRNNFSIQHSVDRLHECCRIATELHSFR